jgi:hypothetical protein
MTLEVTLSKQTDTPYRFGPFLGWRKTIPRGREAQHQQAVVTGVLCARPPRQLTVDKNSRPEDHVAALCSSSW